VPGGWAPQFGYQTFVGPGAAGFGVAGGYPGYGYGFSYGYGTPFAGQSPYSTPARLNPARANAGATGYLYTPSAQTVNTVDPLIGAIRASTRRKGSR
jgi:hypothetical protein